MAITDLSVEARDVACTPRYEERLHRFRNDLEFNVETDAKNGF